MLAHAHQCTYTNKEKCTWVEHQLAVAAKAKARNRQKLFEADLCDLFVACNFSFNAAENPQTRIFFNKWVPSTEVPDRRKLSGSCQSDGWKNVTKTSILMSTMNVNSRAHLVRTHDMMGHPKTGQEHLEVIKSDMAHMEMTYGVTTVGWVTDDGPDGKSARTLLRKLMPWLILLVCWAHQCNLLVGDYLVLNPYPKIITALDHLNSEQLTTYEDLVVHLKPLGIATNILQSSHARLDHVLFTLANLYHTYSATNIEPDVREHMLSKLKAQWKKHADQDLFILVGLLNLTAVEKYLEWEDDYMEEKMKLSMHLKDAGDKEVDLLRIWKLVDQSNDNIKAICTDEHGLPHLAFRVLSVATVHKVSVV
ncbi:hypothetical protein V8D89_007081 [Ganoderma adspersum]